MGNDIMQNVKDKIVQFQSKLNVIDEALQLEMQKDCKDRQYPLLEFLVKEKAVYSFAKQQFENLTPLYSLN